MGVAAVRRQELVPIGGALAQERVADVENRMRPGALGQILDDLAHALVAIDEDHVPRMQALPQRLEIVAQEMVVAAARLGEHTRRGREDLLAQPTEHP